MTKRSFLFGFLFLVDLLEVFCHYKVFPVLGILLRVDLELFALRHNITESGEERSQDEADETWLTLRNHSRLPITQERYRKSLLFLDIALLEEFFVEELCPLYCHVKAPCLRRHISCVYEELKKVLLGFELLCKGFVLDELVSIVTIDHILLIHHCLNLLKIFSVTGHVSGQDYSNKAQMKGLEFIPFESL